MKPFVGVLQHWHPHGVCIKGRVIWDQRHNPVTTEFAPGHRVVTSKVIRLKAVPNSDFSMLETENSFSVLLGKAQERE